MNILISSFGITWEILAEVLGFINYQDFDIYKDHDKIELITKDREKYFQDPVDEFWVLSTDSEKIKDKFNEFQNWHIKNGISVKSKHFVVPSVEDINSMEASEAFRKFCYEKMYEAREKVGNEGKLYVGISGGRKTMSSDLSDAAYVFGSDALIHIIDLFQALLTIPAYILTLYSMEKLNERRFH